jgi:predicted RNA methylase
MSIADITLKTPEDCRAAWLWCAAHQASLDAGVPLDLEAQREALTIAQAALLIAASHRTAQAPPAEVPIGPRSRLAEALTGGGIVTTTDLLELGSDRALRRRLFTEASFEHPAKLNLNLLSWLLERYTRPGDTIADPMAGIGGLCYAALLQRNVVLREIEPRWLTHCHRNAAQILRLAGLFAGSIQIGQADAREPWGYTADHVVFSPPYGCDFQHRRTAEGYLAQRARRLAAVPHTRRWQQLLRQAHASGAVGFELATYGQHPAQIGHLRGAAYWQAMTAVYAQARNALKPGGVMILIIKDHIKDGERVRVADQTVDLCGSLGFALTERHARRVWPISLWQRRRKEQGKPIVEEEDILILVKETEYAKDT